MRARLGLLVRVPRKSDGSSHVIARLRARRFCGRRCRQSQADRGDLLRHFGELRRGVRSPLLSRHGRARVPQDARPRQRLRRARSAERQAVAERRRRSARIADRRRGVGFDQLLCSSPRERADVFMRVFNADGSEAGACGNGTRCVARLLMEEHGASRARIETRGRRRSTVTRRRAGLAVDMGRPALRLGRDPAGAAVDTLALDLGAGPLAAAGRASTWAIRMPSSSSTTPRRSTLEQLGPELEHHPLFPERANIGFAQVRDRRTIRAAGVRARCRADAGLRQRRLRRAGGGRAARPRRATAPTCSSTAASCGSPGRGRGAVPMTGPARHSFAGTLDPELLGGARLSPRRVEVVTFGCRLNTLRVRGDARPCRGRGLDGHGDRPHLRGDRRGRAPGAPGDPPGAARAAGRAHRRHRLRRPDRRRAATPRCPRSTIVVGNAEKLRPETVARARRRRRRAIVVGDIMARARDRAAAWSTASTAARAPSSRCSRAATIAAPSASSPTAAARAAACRCGAIVRPGPRLVESGYRRGRADRRRP